MIDRDKGYRSGGAFAWFFQRISGAFLLFALLVHFWVLHFFPSAHGEITYTVVMERLQHPLWRAFDMMFLICALYHGMTGLQLVIQDYIRRSSWRILCTGVVWIWGLFFLVIGSMTILGLS